MNEQGPRRAILGQLPRMYRADGSPIRVLLVDDERALTNLVRMALRYEGWEIDTAHDAAEAVAMYRANPPDLLVLDIMLPDMDGFGVLAELRAGALHAARRDGQLGKDVLHGERPDFGIGDTGDRLAGLEMLVPQHVRRLVGEAGGNARLSELRNDVVRGEA